MPKELQILIVDDDEADQKILQRAIRQSGLQAKCHIAKNKAEVLQVPNLSVFDCCFLDYLLPDCNGIELVKDIREKNPALPTIIITSQSDEKLATAAIQAGSTNYITKSLITPEGIFLIIKNSINICEIENKLQIARQEALRNAQIKQDFLANMSHEIRTPMNAILGFAGLLLKEPLNEIQKDYLQSIYNSAENLLLIINDVLDISKIESGKMQLEEVEFDLSASIVTVYKTLKALAENKGLKFNLYFDSQIPKTVIGDSLRISQILINLLSNAIKFTKAGSISLNIKLTKKNADNCTILMEVQDSGIGIEKEKQKLIFDTFTQANVHTTREYGGTGLGLSIVQNLVQLMNSEIKIESEINKGSIFYFYLTLPYKSSQPNTGDSLKNSIDLIDTDLSKIRVLLVEDNEVNQKLVGVYLKQMGCTYEIAKNGKLALQILNHSAFDIILMDIQMPEMDGVEATIKIREKNQQIPIIAVTAHAFKEEQERCFKIGMNGYLTKPFRIEELTNAIQTHLLKNKKDTSTETPRFTSNLAEKGNRVDLSFIKENVASDTETINEFLNLFIELVKKFKSQMHISISQNDYKSAYDICHEFKPSCQMLGLNGLYQLILNTEELLRNKSDLVMIRDNYNKAENMLKIIEIEVNKILQSQ